MPYIVSYSPSKAFNKIFSASLAYEMGLGDEQQKNVEVLAVDVADVMTPGNAMSSRVAGSITPTQMAKDIIARVGCGRLIVPGNWIHAILEETFNWMPREMANYLLKSMMSEKRIKEQKTL